VDLFIDLSFEFSRIKPLVKLEVDPSVLKPKGKYCIGDLRRDMNTLVKWFMKLMTKPKEINQGLVSSIDASYTVDEIRKVLEDTRLKECQIEKNIMGLVITGQKIVWT